uniref:Translation initiation factor IF-2, chloroplastic n=1 Tax=Gracilaria tenuistipitata var. liui TaxID=285951 RepID=IF2C_GRATL|nr:translation initiation factor 2 [Gracilaria tenuistipitata var. liui]Q6B8S2.1 RecName: Full=Translation initiation factor IF-2, chloroplastic [Gracilaria tenuistipitata var. liui]AAT79713.1 translation initiation factor 2 [Gracilaria tenuistipitata var. liui]
MRYSNVIDFSICMSIKSENTFLLENPKFIKNLKFFNIHSSQEPKSPTDIRNSVENSDFNVQLENKLKNSFKQDGKQKSKKKKILSVDLDQEHIFKKKNKSKVIISAPDDLTNNSEGSFKSGKQKKKEKGKHKQNVNKDIHHTKNNRLSNLDPLDDINKDKSVIIDSSLSIEELSIKLKIPPAEIITGLFLKGISVTVNQIIDIAIATQVAQKYNFTVINQNQNNQSELDQSDKLQQVSTITSINRAPIVTILGHVDHGKTTLLDAIRNTNAAGKEIGGITQSIKAYEVNWPYNSSNQKLIFIDTPGHEAFSSMRLRCAQITDIVILIIAADDGLKPQTIEAINYISSKKTPFIVAINKIDKANLNLIRVREELATYNIISTDWGGEIQFIEISALQKRNISQLLTAICSLAEFINLKADPTELVQGSILEAYLDKTKGIVVNIIVLSGTLHIGDIIVSGHSYGRVKKIINSLGNELIQAGPSSILEVLGFYSIPQTGRYFQVVNSEKEAKKMIAQIPLSGITQTTKNILNLNPKVYNHNLNTRSLNLIIKADTQGTIDAIINSFIQISQKKIKLNILTASLGVVSNTDLDLAFSTQALIIAFNINISTNILNAAEKLNLSLRKFVLIYDLVDYVTYSMLDLVDPEYDKILIGQAEVQTTFTINKGTVAGCIVKSGKLKKDALIGVYRKNKLIYEGVINSLKRMKNDVNEVVIGNECGILSKDYHFWQSEDLIKAYELHEKAKTL